MLITDMINNITTFDFKPPYTNGWLSIMMAYPNYSVNVTMEKEIGNYEITDHYTRPHNYIETWVFDSLMEA